MRGCSHITFSWVCWLIFVYCRLDVAEGGRRRTLLQDADCVAKLIRKLDTKHIHVKLTFVLIVQNDTVCCLNSKCKSIKSDRCPRLTTITYLADFRTVCNVGGPV